MRTAAPQGLEDLVNYAALIAPGVLLGEDGSLMTAWHDQAQSMRLGHSYTEFLTRLRREWAIETGQIEHLYDISEGATKTLIEQGLDASLLTHEDTDKPASEVIAYIKDQYEAIDWLYQFVGGDRPAAEPIGAAALMHQRRGSDRPAVMIGAAIIVPAQALKVRPRHSAEMDAPWSEWESNHWSPGAGSITTGSSRGLPAERA